MKSDWRRGLFVFVLGMLAFGVFAEVFLISVSPAIVVLTVSVFFFNMMTQMRLRTQPSERDQDGGMAAWVLPVMFVLGAASCAAVFWIAFRWASGSPISPA